MKIISNYSGSNITVLSHEGNQFVLKPDMRDSNPDWFYWNFGVENAQGRTIEFKFTADIVGRFGPAISKDLKTWKYDPNQFGKNEINSKSFVYTFKANEKIVYFSFAIPYQLSRFNDLCMNLNHKDIYIETLTYSKKGRQIPVMTIGKNDAKEHVVLSARHHACESTASYVLEGVVLEAINQIDENDVQFIILPFADLDGVEDGDQGKFRLPHDHNRDYGETPIYNEIRAWKKYIHGMDITIALDMHCPYKWGGRNDHVFLCYKSELGSDDEKFINSLKKHTENDVIKYESTYDIGIDVDWNLSTTKNATNFYKELGSEIVFTVEVPYFGLNKPYQKDDFIKFGKRVYKSLIEHINNKS